MDTEYVPSGNRDVVSDVPAIIVVTALAHELFKIPAWGASGSKVTLSDCLSVTVIDRVAPPFSVVVKMIWMEPDITVSGNDPVTANAVGVSSYCAALSGASNVGAVVVGGI
jgi:hypothetical protein